jgi:uncharacterized protein (TIGR03545 family)
MRWGYIIPRGVLLAGIWAFFAFGFDPLLRYALVDVGEKAASAEVTAGAVKTILFPPRITVEKVQIADRHKPGTNLVEFETLDLNIDGGSLLKKLYIINEGTLSGLRWGTPREDSGLLPETAAPKEEREAAEKESAGGKPSVEEELQSRGKQLFAGLADRGQLELDPQQFESIRMGTELEKQWTAEFARLQGEADELTKQIDSIESQVKANSGNKLERLEAYRAAAGDSGKALQEIKQLRGDLDAQMKQARQDFAAFNQAQQHDRETIRDKADLFKTDPQQLTEMLLGPELNHRLQVAIGWVQTGKAWYRQHQKDKAQPQRMRGEQITFTRDPDLPEFLIELLNIDGTAELEGQPLEFSGTVAGITSDPALYGKPAMLQLKGTGAADLDLKVVFDYTDPQKEPVHTVLLSYSTAHPEPLSLGNQSSLSVTVSAEKLTCRAELRLVGDAISGKVNLRQEPAKLAVKLGGKGKVDPHIAEAVADIFDGVHEIDAQMQIGGKLTAPRWSIQSDLGRQIAGGLKGALSKQLEGERQALADKLDQALASQTSRLQDLFKAQTKGLTGQLNSHEQELRQLVQQATGGRLADLENVAGKPLGKLIKQPQDSKKGGAPVDFSKEEDQAKEGLKKLFGR